MDKFPKILIKRGEWCQQYRPFLSGGVREENLSIEEEEKTDPSISKHECAVLYTSVG